MNWTQLLSARRFGEISAKPLYETRSRFEQDYDRIIFSHPFRKLQDKTQVFPMPEDDFVHTRLTHSLEVASVGRSLGKEAGQRIIDRHPELKKAGITYHDFGAITAAAALTHDVGNPPFGHSGEASISSFFQNTVQGQFFIDKVSAAEWNDLTHFEGNAQGFRILNHPRHGGLKLSFATLAAFTKYPRSSSAMQDKSRKSQKKYGFTQAELKFFQELAQEAGLVNLSGESWVRHPLAFLVEAADDICYSIIDLEDGTRLGLVPFETTKDLLAQVIGERYSEEKLNKIDDLNEKLGTLRAMTIYQLVQETVEAFMHYEDKMLEGTFDQALTDIIPSSKVLHKISSISVDRIYRSQLVIEREASGYAVIEKLMNSFCFAAFHMTSNSGEKSAQHETVFRLLPNHLIREIHDKNLTTYQLLLIVIDFISSLTDSSALRLFRIINGNPKI